MPSDKVTGIETPAQVIHIPKWEITLYEPNGTVWLPAQTPKGTPKTYRIQIRIAFCWPCPPIEKQHKILLLPPVVKRKAVEHRLHRLTHSSQQRTGEGCAPSSLTTPEACVPTFALEQYKQDHFHSSGLFGSNVDIIQLGKNDLMKHIL